MIPEFELVADGERYNIMLRNPPEGFEEFVDQLSLEDPYPFDVWCEIKMFLQQQTENPPVNWGWPGSRYEFAQWMRSQMKCLATYSLGHVCHLVQLGVSKRELLGYR